MVVGRGRGKERMRGGLYPCRMFAVADRLQLRVGGNEDRIVYVRF
jgi:hypothetical protein